MSKQNDDYEIGGIVNTDDVPEWARRQVKYASLVDDIAALLPGQSLKVTFRTRALAKSARNTVRDNVNYQFKKSVIRTRMIENPDGRTTVYFSMLDPAEVVEETRVEPD